MRMNCVICTHGRAELLERTLDSFSHVIKPDGFDSFWIIENGSDGGSRGVCQAFSDTLPVRYIHRKEKGKSIALQFALDEIGNGFVVFSDDDVRG